MVLKPQLGEAEDSMRNATVLARIAATAAIAAAALAGTGCNSARRSDPTEVVSAALTAGPANVAINAGGGAVAPFVADTNFSGGGTINHADTIDLSGVSAPAPAAVYQTARTGGFTYNVGGFAAGSSHLVRLHFAETYFTAAGSRVFNVSINGTQVLASFDIFKAAGAKDRAYITAFTEAADATGAYAIQFTSVVNVSLVSGIEITNPCAPTTCAALGKNCGSISDGCGGTLACGACSGSQTCGGSGVGNLCGGSCTPSTCAALGKNCGSVPDGCGGTLSCGGCSGSQTCGGSGVANVCGSGCVPTTCAALGKN
jgi:hypothetical protein